MQAANLILTEQLRVRQPPKEPYFVDFLRDAPEATGEEADDDELDDPKIYEQV